MISDADFISMHHFCANIVPRTTRCIHTTPEKQQVNLTKRLCGALIWCRMRFAIRYRERCSPLVETILVWSTSIGLGGHLRSPDAVAVCQSADWALSEQHTGTGS